MTYSEIHVVVHSDSLNMFITLDIVSKIVVALLEDGKMSINKIKLGIL